MDLVLVRAFCNEVEKLAACRALYRGTNSRSGRRPMKAETLIRKEKEGTLFKRSDGFGDVPTRDVGTGQNTAKLDATQAHLDTAGPIGHTVILER